MKVKLPDILQWWTIVAQLQYQKINRKCVKYRQERAQNIVLNGSVGQYLTVADFLTPKDSAGFQYQCKKCKT